MGCRGRSSAGSSGLRPRPSDRDASAPNGLAGATAGPSDAGQPFAALTEATDGGGLGAPRDQAQDPPAPIGDLAAEIAQFSDVAGCVTSRAPRQDPIVGDAMEAIGYDTLFHDACTLLLAAKQRSVVACQQIDPFPLQRRCVATVAMLTGRPEDCPLDVPAKPSEGRMPTCLAVVTRDPRMCAAEDPIRKATCEALATGDAQRCGNGRNAPKCRRETERWRSSLPTPEAHRPTPLPAPSAQVSFAPENEAPPLPSGELDVSADVAMGVVLVDGLLESRVEIGHALASRYTNYRSMPLSHARMAVDIVVHAGLPPKVEHFELDVPNSGTLVCPSPRCNLEATVEPLAKTRGGAFEASVRGRVAIGALSYNMKVQITTFVRDIVTKESAR